MFGNDLLRKKEKTTNKSKNILLAVKLFNNFFTEYMPFYWLLVFPHQ